MSTEKQQDRILFDLDLRASKPRALSTALQSRWDALLASTAGPMAGSEHGPACISFLAELLCLLSGQANWTFSCSRWDLEGGGMRTELAWTIEAGPAGLDYELDQGLSDSWQRIETFARRLEARGLPEWCEIRWNDELATEHSSMELTVTACDEAREAGILELAAGLFAELSHAREHTRLVPAAYGEYCREVLGPAPAGGYPEPGVALLDAVARRDAQRVRRLLEMGVSPEQRDADGRPALMSLAYGGDKEIASLLLDCGADVDAVDAQGETSLMLAAAQGQSGLVGLLLARGAQVNASDKYGYSPLLHALKEGQTALARTLIEAGADVHASATYGWNALMLTAKTGDVELARALVGRGLPVQAYTDYGCSALSEAAAAGQLGMLECLLDAGAKVDNACCQYAKGHDITLAGPAAAGHPDVLRLLLDRGARADAPGRDGRTALMLAVHNDHPACVEVLLEAGADPDQKDDRGQSARSIAKAEGRRACLDRIEARAGPPGR
ncbi:MAG: ankyrin repeat domain-containing protein [Deltaproteobacteria bacterium]|nr:ankyrin repeat domain-containing protein [Deltaproteobacteria bacterium]